MIARVEEKLKKIRVCELSRLDSDESQQREARLYVVQRCTRAFPMSTSRVRGVSYDPLEGSSATGEFLDSNQDAYAEQQWREKGM